MGSMSMSVSVGLVGLGLCTIGLGLLFGPRDLAQAAPAPAMAVAGQAAPTVVWMHSYMGGGEGWHYLFRGWSDGRIDIAVVPYSYQSSCTNTPSLFCGWKTIQGTEFGFACAADLDHDGKVDGSDLGQLLATWGPVSCVEVPPVECGVGGYGLKGQALAR